MGDDRARATARRDRDDLAAAEGYLDRLRPSARPRRAGARARARDRPGPARSPMLIPAVRRGALRPRPARARRSSCSDGAIEVARLTGQRPGARLEPPLGRAAARHDVRRARRGARRRRGGRRGQPRAARRRSSRSCAETILGLVLIERGDPARGIELLIGIGGGDGAARLARGVARLGSSSGSRSGWLALGRLDGRRARRRGAAECAARTGLRLAAAAADRAARRARARPRRRGGGGRRARRRSIAAAEAIGAIAEAAVSRCSPGGRSPPPATPRARRAELERSRGRLRRLRRGAAAATRPSASSASSAAACTAARGRQAPTARGVDSLTERELQVARLIVDRRTNAADRRRAVPQPEDGRDATSATCSRSSTCRRAWRSRARSSAPTAHVGALSPRRRDSGCANQGRDARCRGAARAGKLAVHSQPRRGEADRWRRISTGSAAGRSSTAATVLVVWARRAGRA